MSVGPDEVVVTFTTGGDEVVATRVGTAEIATDRASPRRLRAGPRTGHRVPPRGGRRPPGRFLPGRVRTLVRPPGRLLATVATANDTHLGEVECGRTGDPATDAIGPILRAGPGEPPYPETMNRAVVDEMRALDPDAVVVKG